MIRLLDIVSLMIELGYGFILFTILTAFLPLKRSAVVKVISYICCYGLSSVIIYANEFPELIGMLFAFMIYILLLHRGRVIEKISAVMIFYPIVVAVNFLTLDIGARFFFWLTNASDDEVVSNPEMLLISTAIHTASLAIRLLFWIFSLLLLRPYLSQNIRDLNNRMWLIIDTIVTASFTSIIIVIYFMPENFIYYYPICAAAVITNYGCIYLVSYICQSVRTAYHVNELELKFSYYEDKLKDEQRVRSLYHDLKNHLLILQQQVNSEGALEMIESLQEQVKGYENYYQTGNDMLDIIIRDKSRLAQENNIDFSAIIHFEEGGFVDPLDISTLFGNALDNAIEASIKLPPQERIVTVKASRFREMLSVMIENNMVNEQASGKRTTKEEAFLHGFGLNNIRAVVQKYNGECSIKQGDGKFVLKMIIPIPST